MAQLVVFTIVGTINDGITMKAAKDFAGEAVAAWGGQFSPDDPLFDSVSVTHISCARIAQIPEEE